MKKSILYPILAICLVSFGIKAQAPQKFSYQAVIRNGSNALIANATVGVKISILQSSPAGGVVYAERHIPTTNANGLATFEIGAGSRISGTMAGIDWGNGSYYIKTEVDPTGGTSYSVTGTSQLLSVPYALHAASGTQGPMGATGPQGPAGVSGTQGPMGATGPQGPQGPIGMTGATGPAGTIGATGPQGPQGVAGTGVRIVGSVVNVSSLNPNYQGSIGDMMIVSSTGGGHVWNGTSWVSVGQIQGPVGPQGPIGLTGATGSTGPQGAAGSQGPAGPIGPQGPQGATGPAGAIGLQGPQGATGMTGPSGPQGPAGTAFVLPYAGTTGLTNIDGNVFSVKSTGSGGAILGESISEFGVLGASTSGSGVVGASSVDNGVWGNSNSGNGVYGKSTSKAGVKGESTSSFGVEGSSSSSYGVKGTSSSSIGVAGNSTSWVGVVGVSTSASGVWGNSVSGTGVHGSSDSGFGIYGSSTTGDGIKGESFAAGKAGVLGVSSLMGGGGAPGVFGQSISGQGVRGESISNFGVVGQTTGSTSFSGVYGFASDAYGVWGYSNYGAGVYGYSDFGVGVRAQTNISSQYSLAAYNGIGAFKNVGGNTWATPSDERLKKDIRPFTDGLDVILKIEPKRYYYNGLANTNPLHEEFGIIAQEMQKIAPYTVSKHMLDMTKSGDKGDPKMEEMLVYNSGALTYVTINAIKEQQAMIERQSSIIEIQSSTINELKIELNAQSAKIKVLEQALNEIKSLMKN